MKKQETKSADVLADMEKKCEYLQNTFTTVLKDISEYCLLGERLIEELYALTDHVRFGEGET